jgi:hypothetical protein
LVERLNGIQKVRGSTPLTSTNNPSPAGEGLLPSVALAKEGPSRLFSPLAISPYYPTESPPMVTLSVLECLHTGDENESS